jgi:cysteine desulfurase
MRPRCYLDHNATSPLRPEARAAMIAAFDCAGNPSSIHGEGRAARQIVEAARETAAALFEVEPAAVYFTSGGTEAANWLLQPRGGETLAVSAVEHPCVLAGHRFGQDRSQTREPAGSAAQVRQAPPHPVLLPASLPWQAGTLEFPHPLADADGRRDARNSLGGNSGVLSPLGERDRVRGDSATHSTGFSLIPVFEDGSLDFAALEAALSPGSVAAVQAANNETGAVQLTAEIAQTVHSKGAGLICDAVQAVGRLPLRELKDADVLFFSAHKFGGPKGIGAVIVRNPAFAPAPLLKGGGQERRQRSGTENVPGIAGLAAALEVAVLEQAAFAARAKAWRDKLECGIRDIAPDAVIFGLPLAGGFQDGAPNGRVSPHPVPLPMGEGTVLRAPRPIQASLLPGGEGQGEGSELRAYRRCKHRLPNTTCFAIPGKSAELSLIALDLEGIAVSSGSACSSGKVGPSHVLAAMGVPPELARGAIRVSTGWTTTEADIERFLTTLSRICERRDARHRTCSYPHAGHAV